MKNKWLKKTMLFLALGCLTFSVIGCKAEHLFDKVLEKTDSKESKEEKTEEVQETEPKVEVAKPEFTANLSGSVTYKKGDTAEPLTVEATASDGGTITYQWYQSLTNTNGGGTVIEGETKNTFTPSTKEEGTMYYYAVATSTIGSSTNRITSDTKEVIVASADAQAAPENASEEQKAEEQKPEEKKTEEKPTEQSEEKKPAEGQAAQ